MQLEDEWHIMDNGMKHGPLTWATVIEWRSQGRISPSAQIWKEGWLHWDYLHNFLPPPPASSSDREVQALMPTKEEGIIYIGIVVYVLGFATAFISPILPFIIMIIGLGIEIYGLREVFRNVERTAVGTIGDIMMILIMVGQFLVLGFFVFLIMNM
ncbi:MAG: DUF4339 domain-containing protein [Thermoplasmata archaeon]|nr:DUF4339 domain-containing protein [Thermoplasmata archaeon]